MHGLLSYLSDDAHPWAPRPLGIIDEVVEEPPGAAHTDPEGAALALKEAILRHLSELEGMDPEALVASRREKYYAMGAWEDTAADG